MTVVINGTSGLSGTNGSAGTPAVQGEDTNTGIFFPAADTVAVATAGSERVRVDSSGNAGLGVTPSAWASAWKVVQNQGGFLGANGSSVQLVGSNSYSDGTNWRYVNTGLAANYSQVNGVHSWSTAPSGTAGNAITFTQAMTLEANGNLLVATTSWATGQNAVRINGYGAGQGRIDISRNTTALADQVYFANPNGVVGAITTNGTTTAYNTSSDYRLKENVAPMQNALDTVAQLNPVTYTWKADGSAGQGFIAHELQAVVPDCVTGEKDAMREEQYEVTPAIAATYDAEGNVLTEAVPAVMGTREVPQYQGVDTSFLVATLCKAIQELTARVAQLEAQ